ncbi:MAG: dihydropteroate synthase [Pyrinomonadaceae bacterium]
MAILNVTPDSFSDGGRFLSVDDALRRAERIVADGADIIDIGGESTRPGGKPVSLEDETNRTIPVVEAIVKRFDTPVSIDTTKSEVARRAVDAGSEIINDISGLRFDVRMAEIAGASRAGLVLMHSRGAFESMHSQPPVDDILCDVIADLKRAVAEAGSHGISMNQIVLDVGIGFGKTLEQNLELLGKLDRIVTEFPEFPILVGASRKSFVGTILGNADVGLRLSGSLSSAAIAVFNGAKVVRVHDVKETIDVIKVASAIRNSK